MWFCPPCLFWGLFNFFYMNENKGFELTHSTSNSVLPRLSSPLRPAPIQTGYSMSHSGSLPQLTNHSALTSPTNSRSLGSRMKKDRIVSPYSRTANSVLINEQKDTESFLKLDNRTLNALEGNFISKREAEIFFVCV